MGFGTEKPKTTYVNIVGGKLAVKTTPETEGAVKRINKNNEPVWELIYPSLNAMLLNIECNKNDKLGIYEYRITLDDIGNTYSLSIPTDSRYGDSFANRILNLKKGEWYTFVPYDFEDTKGKTRNGGIKKIVGINIFLQKEKVPYYFTKETPNGHPPYPENADEDDFKAFKIQLRKFYRGLVDRWVEVNGTPKEVEKISHITDNITNPFDKDTSDDFLF